MTALVKDKSLSKDGVVRRCSNRLCNKKTSVREGSWFSGSHLLLKQAVKRTYYWVYELPGGFISRQLKIRMLTGKTLQERFVFVLRQGFKTIVGPGKRGDRREQVWREKVPSW